VKVTSVLRQEAKRLYEEGWTLAAIAGLLAVSHERVRQIRDEDGWMTRWVGPREAARAAGLSPYHVYSWRASGFVQSSPSGLVDSNEIMQVMGQRLSRPCEYPGCSQTVGRLQRRVRFCPVHSEAERHYRYPLMTPEERRRHATSVVRWRLKNPEQARVIEKRATKRYRERLRTQGNQSDA
jgi:hypothetical protein